MWEQVGYLKDLSGKDLIQLHVEMNTNACLTLKTIAVFHYLKSQNNLQPYYDYLEGKLTRDDFWKLADKTNSVINQEISEETIDSIFEKIDALKDGNKLI